MATATSISLSSLTPSFSSLSFSSRVSRVRPLYHRPNAPTPSRLGRNTPRPFYPSVIFASSSSSPSFDDDDFEEEEEEEVEDYYDEDKDDDDDSFEPSLDDDEEGDGDDSEPSSDDAATTTPFTYSPFTGTKPSEETGDMSLEKYVKMRLPGGFAAQQYLATGRRKRAIARVVLQEGTGKVVINYRDAHDYMQGNPLWLEYCKTPLLALGYESNYDIFVKAHGGGLSGQAQAICLGVARALLKISDIHRPPLRKAGLLTRDARKVERKKVGLKKARKAPQYSKR